MTNNTSNVTNSNNGVMRIANICTYNEVDMLIRGCNESESGGNLTLLRLNCTYLGAYHADHPIIEWFWDILSEFTSKNRKDFLHFVTGSSRIPIGGVSKIKLYIQSNNESESNILTSHTCFNLLDIPCSYSKRSVLSDRLHFALLHSYGFGFA